MTRGSSVRRCAPSRDARVASAKQSITLSSLLFDVAFVGISGAPFIALANIQGAIVLLITGVLAGLTYRAVAKVMQHRQKGTGQWMK